MSTYHQTTVLLTPLIHENVSCQVIQSLYGKNRDKQEQYSLHSQVMHNVVYWRRLTQESKSDEYVIG